jgi:hypothetical protein
VLTGFGRADDQLEPRSARAPFTGTERRESSRSRRDRDTELRIALDDAAHVKVDGPGRRTRGLLIEYRTDRRRRVIVRGSF